MCIGRHVRRSGAVGSSFVDNGALNHAYTDVTSHTPAWTRTFRQPMKPMLPRKLTSSARINLNQYWNVLEELVQCNNVTMDVQDGGESFGDDDVDMSNEINENLANERLEKSRDAAATCQSEVEIAVSLDNCTLWEKMSESA